MSESCRVSSQLLIQARDCVELPERVLRVIRHRGFQVNWLQMQRRGAQITLELTLTSERPLAFLLPQLQKLPDVTTVISVLR